MNYPRYLLTMFTFCQNHVEFKFIDIESSNFDRTGYLFL